MNNIIIRKITVQDADMFLKLLNQTDFEMLDVGILDADELGKNFEQVKYGIEKTLKSNNSMVFVAEDNGKLIGYLEAYGGVFNRVKHCIDIAIAIIKEFQGKGIGYRLFQELEKWVVDVGVHRLELRVNEKNIPAISLYKKLGFQTDCLIKDAVLINNEYQNAYQMSKLL